MAGGKCVGIESNLETCTRHLCGAVQSTIFQCRCQSWMYKVGSHQPFVDIVVNETAPRKNTEKANLRNSNTAPGLLYKDSCHNISLYGRP